jgi:class 3 adenylate cyclase/tetratricopeptide (TPR) repeat protein
MWKWILRLVCASIGQLAAADESKAPALALEDPYTWTWAAMDNPVALRSWAQERMETLKPESEARLWSLAVAAFFRKAQSEDFTPHQRERLEKALDLAAQHALPPLALFDLKDAAYHFKLLDTHGQDGVLPPDQNLQRLRHQVNLAENLKLPGRKAQASLDWGYALLDSGRESEAVKKIHEALRELNKAQGVQDLEIIKAKGIYADALVNLQSREKSRTIYRELEQFCQQKNLRMFCLAVHHAQAYLWMQERTEEAHEKAFAILQRSLGIAEELQDEHSIASIHNYLIRVCGAMGRYQEAEVYGTKAIEMFRKAKNKVWLGDTQRKLSVIYLHLKEPAKALDILNEARENFPADFAMDLAEISYQKAQAYQALRQHKDAYEALASYAAFLKQNAQQSQSADIAQNLTQINLELEEEYSRSLTEAERLQTIETELEQAIRRRQDETLLLINMIWFVSGGLVLSGVLGLLWIHQQNRRILRLNRHLRENILQRFLPPLVAEKVASGQAVLDEIPHEQNVTVLFGRLVGLEHAIEELGPRVTARLLESLMQAVTDVSLIHQGCLDKLHRGSFLILFGAPMASSQDEQVINAMAFAEAILERFAQIREDWPQVAGWQPGLAIGIHQGPALVGVFGGKRRADYTAIGQTVNLAARIEAEAQSGQILVSEAVARFLMPDRCHSLGGLRLKGFTQPQTLFRVDVSPRARNAS